MGQKCIIVIDIWHNAIEEVNGYLPEYVNNFKNNLRIILNIAEIKDIDSQHKAQQFLNVDLYINKSQLPKLQNQIYWYELQGMSVINLDNIVFGVVANILQLELMMF